MSKLTSCLCPSCGRTHCRDIDWCGNGKPRITCKQCRNAQFLRTERYYDELITPEYRVGYSAKAQWEKRQDIADLEENYPTMAYLYQRCDAKNPKLRSRYI